MNKKKLTILLDLDEEKALDKFAAREKRDMRQQATMILRTALEQAGYLQPIKMPVDQDGAE